MAVIEANENNFDSLIQNGYVIIDFYGDHCGACVAMEPHYLAASNDLVMISFLKVNTSVCKELGERYNIAALPTIFFMKDGELKERVMGGLDKETLYPHIAKLLYE